VKRRGFRLTGLMEVVRRRPSSVEVEEGVEVVV
jgi:hypothetical protein